MEILQRLRPWHDPEGEKVKDNRVDQAVRKGRVVEDRIEKLVASSATAVVVIKKTRAN